MMLRWLNLIIMSLFSMAGLSQIPDSFSSMKDSSEFRERVKERADTVSTVQSDFNQVKDMSFMEEKVKSQGRFSFKKPNKVRWEYTDPFQHRIFIRKDELTVKGAKKEDSYDMGSNEMFRRMNDMIVSSVRGQVFDNEHFEPSYYENASFYLVALNPEGGSMKEFFEEMRLYFSKTEYEVRKVVMLGSSGDSTIIRFENKRVNVPISNSHFEPGD